MYECKLRLKGRKGLPTRICVSQRGNVLVSTGHDLALRIWNSATGKLIHSSKYLDDGFRQAGSVMDVSRDGQYVATGVPDQSTKVFSTNNGERLVRWNKKRANQLCFSPDGSCLAAAVGKNVECFRAGDWVPLSTLSGHTSKVHLLGYCPDGRTLVSAAGKYVKLWDVSTNKLRTTLEGHSKQLGSMAIAPDSSLLATGGEDNQVILWDLPKGKPIATYSDHSSYVFDLAVSPDGDTIASADYDGELRLWRRSSLETFATMAGEPWIEKLAFSPDGKHLAFSSGEEGVRLVETKKGKVVASLPESVDLAWSPKGDWLASGDKSDIVLWNTSVKSRKAK